MPEDWIAGGIVAVLLIACILGGCAELEDEVDE